MKLGIKKNDSDSGADEEIQLINKLIKPNTVSKKCAPVAELTVANIDHNQQSQHQQQQIKLLKQIVKTLEEKSMKEKIALQKQLAKKRQECESFRQQLTEAKITERGLRSELRQLSNEIRILKQHNR